MENREQKDRSNVDEGIDMWTVLDGTVLDLPFYLR